jgi:hypothetical protein
MLDILGSLITGMLDGRWSKRRPWFIVQMVAFLVLVTFTIYVILRRVF